MSAIPDVGPRLKEQYPVINNLVEEGRNNLESLWAGHLMERGMYGKVAFMITAENVHPNLHRGMVYHHMDIKGFVNV